MDTNEEKRYFADKDGRMEGTEREREGGSDRRREAGAGGMEKERKKGQTRFRFRR